jgi:hypothetical protein
MPMSTPEFLYRSNVLNYLRLLRAAPDQERRTILMRLLAEEAANAKQHGWTSLVN